MGKRTTCCSAKSWEMGTLMADILGGIKMVQPLSLVEIKCTNYIIYIYIDHPGSLPSGRIFTKDRCASFLSGVSKHNIDHRHDYSCLW